MGSGGTRRCSRSSGSGFQVKLAILIPVDRQSAPPRRVAAIDRRTAGGRRASSSARQTYSPTHAQRQQLHAGQADDHRQRAAPRRPPPSAGSRTSTADHASAERRAAARPDVRAPADRQVGERGDRVDDQLDLPRSVQPDAPGARGCLSYSTWSCRNPIHVMQREHADVALGETAERVDRPRDRPGRSRRRAPASPSCRRRAA